MTNKEGEAEEDEEETCRNERETKKNLLSIVMIVNGDLFLVYPFSYLQAHVLFLPNPIPMERISLISRRFRFSFSILSNVNLVEDW